MDNNEIISQIENDEFYKTFLGSRQKPSTAVQALSITEQVKKLGEGIDIIGRELQKQIQERHHDLLRQGNHATKLEQVLNTMNSHVQNLVANAERLRNQIIGPYNALELHTRVLGRLHLASHILRQVSRVQHLSKRLSNTNDTIQKATILNELEQLAADEDLKDIDAVTLELRNIRSQRQKVVKMATSSLTQGIANENLPQTTTALQIFINLGTINSTLDQFLENALSECRESLKSAFEIGGVSSSSSSRNKGPGRVNLTSSQGFRNRIWTDLERVFTEDFYHQCKQVKFLQETVDNLSGQEVETDIASQFWHKLGDIIQSEIANASPAIHQTLDEDYPKILKCYYEIYEKLKCKKFVFNRQVLEKCENAYLSSSLTKLLEPVQQMFASELDVPNHDQIDSLIRIVTSELSVALIEASLSEKICRNVSKCIKMFAVKTEQQVETGPEAVQVIGGSANSGQQKNVQLANSLYYLQVQIKRMLSNMKESLSDNGISLINEGLQALSNLVGAIIHPIIVSINMAIESIIITIHLESDWGKLQPSNRTMPCSPYMRELTQFIDRVYHTYLENFEDKEVLLAKCSDVAIRCIELLVRHSSLLRPLSQGGRQRLQSDYQQLENSLKLICPQLTDLGRPYRLLKSMASLVAQTPEQIVASQAEESSVPHSTVLLLLFSFAGNELASPHQNTGWSLPKLSAWLDEHPLESDRLDLIAGALQKYEALVRQKNSTNYDPVYPIMSQFLENAVKSLRK